MVKHYRSKEVTWFHPRNAAGQRATDYDRWADATMTYEIQYEPRYEPWGIMSR